MAFHRLTEEHYDQWNRLVEQSPQGTIFHQVEWRQAIDTSFVLYGYFQDNKLIAGIPVFERRIARQKVMRFGNLTPYSGLVSVLPADKLVTMISAQKQLMAEAATFLKSQYKAVLMSFPPNVVDVQPFVWEGYQVKLRYSYVLDTSDLDVCWAGMHRGRRKGIRQAEKQGLRIALEDDFEVMLDLVVKTYARQSIAFNSVEATRRLHRLLSAKGQSGIFIVRDQAGRPVAGAYVGWDNKRGYGLLTGYDHECGYDEGTALALWGGIQHTHSVRGLAEFDFVGSSVPSIELFLRKFGGRLVPRYQVTWMEPRMTVGYALARGVQQIRRQLRRRRAAEEPQE